MKIQSQVISLVGLILISALITFTGARLFILFSESDPIATEIQAQDLELKIYTTQELMSFDGSSPDKPIYIGLDGLVYNVTAGKSFYQPGGVYHFLAGKDSSEELHKAGEAIIKRKYPVVGKLQ